MRTLIWSICLLSMALLTSCTVAPPADHTPLKEQPPVRGQGVGTKSGQGSRETIPSRLERRDFFAALRLMQQEVHSGRTESSLAKEYDLALRGGMNYCEALREKGEIGKSGICFHQLLKLYPRSLPMTGVSPEQIKKLFPFYD